MLWLDKEHISFPLFQSHAINITTYGIHRTIFPRMQAMTRQFLFSEEIVIVLRGTPMKN